MPGSFAFPFVLLLTLKQTNIASAFSVLLSSVWSCNASSGIGIAAVLEPRSSSSFTGLKVLRIIELLLGISSIERELNLRSTVGSTEVAMEKKADHVVETAVEARAGFLGRPVLLVLVVSCVLAVALMTLAYVGVVKI